MHLAPAQASISTDTACGDGRRGATEHLAVRRNGLLDSPGCFVEAPVELVGDVDVIQRSGVA